MVFNMKNTKKIYKQLSLTVFLLLTMTGFSSAVYAVSDQSNTAQIQSSANKKLSYQRSFKAHKVPELELVDMQGNQVILASLINAERPVLLNFIFTTCPSFCPILSATFGQVQHKFDSDNPIRPLLVSISIDPEHDTPERLKKYASKFKAGPDWMFLTGSYDVILKVQQLFDVYKGEKMNHQPVTLLHKPGASKWLRLDGFTSSKNLLLEFKQLMSDHSD